MSGSYVTNLTAYIMQLASVLMTMYNQNCMGVGYHGDHNFVDFHPQTISQLYTQLASAGIWSMQIYTKQDDQL